MSEPERITIRRDQHSPVITALVTTAGMSDIEVQVFYSKQTGKQVVRIDAEDSAEFEVLVNDGLIATVSEGGDIVDRLDPAMEGGELLAIRQQVEAKLSGQPQSYSQMFAFARGLKAGGDAMAKFAANGDPGTAAQRLAYYWLSCGSSLANDLPYANEEAQIQFIAGAASSAPAGPAVSVTIPDIAGTPLENDDEDAVRANIKDLLTFAGTMIDDGYREGELVHDGHRVGRYEIDLWK